MSAGKVSVIIPTYNRKAILKKALGAYAQQTAQDSILEVVVVDDGSIDETEKAVSDMASSSCVPIRYLRQENSGQAAARNRGIRGAGGELILFSDDDIIPAPNMVEEHLAWHEKHPEPHIAILGYVPWSPEVRPTPLMNHVIKYGPQLAFAHMTAGKTVGIFGCYFGNTSLKLNFLRQNGLFDESFHSWGFEDFDLGYRLIQKKGMVLLYNPAAVGYHYKKVSFKEVCEFPHKMAASRKLYEATEAGQIFLASEKRRKSTRKYQLQMLFVRLLVPLLFPLKPLLDSRIPLPGAIYRAFYAYHVYFAEKSGQEN